MAYLVYARAETALRRAVGQGERPQRVQKLAHALVAQRAAVEHGEYLPRGYLRPERGEAALGVALARKVGLHQLLVARGYLLQGALAQRAHVQRQLQRQGVCAQPLVQLPRDGRRVSAAAVGLVDEYQHRQRVLFQQPPQRAGVALHAVHRRYQQHGAVQHAQHALRLGGEVDVARRVNPPVALAAQVEMRLVGEYGYAPLALQRVEVQGGGLMVDAPGLLYHPGVVEQLLRKGGLARVDMREYPYGSGHGALLFSRRKGMAACLSAKRALRPGPAAAQARALRSSSWHCSCSGHAARSRLSPVSMRFTASSVVYSDEPTIMPTAIAAAVERVSTPSLRNCSQLPCTA